MKTHHFDYEKGSRVLEQMTKPVFVGTSLAFAGLGAVVLIAGIFVYGLGLVEELSTVPVPVLTMGFSLMLFSMFFPYYLCAWSCRILLRRIHDLEDQVQKNSNRDG